MSTKFRALVISILSFILMTSPAIAAVKAGATCKTKGQVNTVSNYKFTCIKSGTKLIWSKGVKITGKVALTTTTTTTASFSSTPKFY